MSALSPAEVLARLPHARPMRFLSEIVALDAVHIVARYTWTEEDCAGHFPSFPVVPGVKLIEHAAQAACVAWGLYLASATADEGALRDHVGLFASVEEARFLGVVRPGDTTEAVGAFGEEGYFRANKIASEASLRVAGGPRDGEEVFRGRLTGLWIPRWALGAAAGVLP